MAWARNVVWLRISGDCWIFAHGGENLDKPTDAVWVQAIGNLYALGIGSADFLVNGINLNTWTWLAMAEVICCFGYSRHFYYQTHLCRKTKTPNWHCGKTLIINDWASMVLCGALGTYSAWDADELIIWLYLIIGVVLTIGRRVMPMFIERGIAEKGKVEQTVKNSDLLGRLSLISFFVFFLTDIF